MNLQRLFPLPRLGHAPWRYRTTPEVRLSSNKDFATAKQRHKASNSKLDSTAFESPIDVVHVGHFPDDSDTIQNAALFENLRAERHKLRNITSDLSTSFVIRRDGWLLWTIVLAYISSIAVACVLDYEPIISTNRSCARDDKPVLCKATNLSCHHVASS